MRISHSTSLPSIASILMTLAVVGYAGPSDASDLPHPTDLTITLPGSGLPSLDPCSIDAPDETFFVAQEPNLGSPSSTSGNGGYGYRPCPFYIVDVKVASYSYANWDKASIATDAYDLPSAVSDPNQPGATWDQVARPSNAIDCQRFTVARRAYVAEPNETVFKWTGAQTVQFAWNGTHCVEASRKTSGQMNDVLGAANRPDGGWRTYRYLVSAKLRTSYQETAFQLQPVPPTPK